MNNKQCHFRWPRSSRLNLVCLRRLWFRRRHLNVRNHQNGDYISTILQVLQLYHQSGLRHNKKSLLPILIILSTLAQFRVQDRCVAQALMAPWSSGESRHTVRWGFTIWMSNDEHGNSMTLWPAIENNWKYHIIVNLCEIPWDLDVPGSHRVDQWDAAEHEGPGKLVTESTFVKPRKDFGLRGQKLFVAHTS